MNANLKETTGITVHIAVTMDTHQEKLVQKIFISCIVHCTKALKHVRYTKISFLTITEHDVSSLRVILAKLFLLNQIKYTGTLTIQSDFKMENTKSNIYHFTVLQHLIFHFLDLKIYYQKNLKRYSFFCTITVMICQK